MPLLCCRWSYRCVLGLLAAGLFAGAVPLSATAVQPIPNDTADVSDLRTRQLFIQGLTQSYLEDYAEAVSLFENALNHTPNHPAILSALSEAETERDNLTSAIYYARQARTHAPDTVYYHLELAQLLQKAGRTNEAVSAYRTLVSRFPSHPEGRLALGRLLKKQNRPAEAIRHYEALVDASEEVSPEVYHEMIDLYRTTDNQEGLERTLKTLTQLRGDRPLYRHLLGHLYTQQARYQKAISVFEALLDETPNDPRLLSQLKMLYAKTGRTDEMPPLGEASARTTTSPDQLVARSRSIYERSSPLSDSSARAIRHLLQRALEKSPKHTGALDLLGRVYTEQGRYADAGRTFKRALDVNPRTPARWRRAASAYLAADSAQTAATLAEEGALLFPGRSDLVRIEAEARLRLGAYAEARDHFETALSRIDTTTAAARERADLHTGLARTLHHLDHPSQARAAYRDALRLAPTSPPILIHYARHLADRDTQLNRALRLAQRAVDHDDASPKALGTLAWVYAQRGQTDRAVSTFKRALDAGLPDAWVFERFGDLHSRLGNETRARRYWTRALERNPTYSDVKDKLQSAPQS